MSVPAVPADPVGPRYQGDLANQAVPAGVPVLGAGVPVPTLCRPCSVPGLPAPGPFADRVTGAVKPPSPSIAGRLTSYRRSPR